MVSGVTKRMMSLKDADYYSITKKNSATQVVFQVDRVMKSWFAGLKAYKKNPSKFNGRPKMPRYKKKDELNCLTYTYIDAKLQKDGTINISRGIKIPIHTNQKKFQQVRIIPRQGCIQVEIIYNEEVENGSLDLSKAIGIDIGVNVLAAITSNCGGISNLINGRPLKSINQYYNKQRTKIKEQLNKDNIKSSKKLRCLEFKRFCKIKDYMHKTSRRIVDLMKENNIGTCFIGHNDGWKQECHMGKKNNQNFVSIPFNMLIGMIRYKLEEAGGTLIELNESHTSKCSFLDNEKICHHDKYLGKRKKRGLFISANNMAINADINGSLNILKMGMGYTFEINKMFFNPVKIDIEKKCVSLRDNT